MQFHEIYWCVNFAFETVHVLGSYSAIKVSLQGNKPSYVGHI